RASASMLIVAAFFVIGVFSDVVGGLVAVAPILAGLIPRVKLASIRRRHRLGFGRYDGRILAEVILRRIGSAGIGGGRWFSSRPRIVGIEFEMDLRGRVDRDESENAGRAREPLIFTR